MSMNKKYGVRAGEQVPLRVANLQAGEVSASLRERQDEAAQAAADAVQRVLGGAPSTPQRTRKALRASGKHRKG